LRLKTLLFAPKYIQVVKMQLPFKTPPRQPDTIEVGDPATGILEMPRYCSLTVAEDLAWTEVLASAEDTNDGRLLLARVRPKLAAIALRRIMPELADEDMDKPPLNSARLQEMLFNYLNDEKNGKIPPEPADPKARPLAGATSGSARKRLTAASTPDSVDDGPTGTTTIPLLSA
jgi:hypothetical protein